jgi:BirA family biotin operon repressor/biotin-[acetyl-CoA-carboxylase] ligase
MENLQEALADLPLGAIRYFEIIGSTNDEAAIWAEADAPDLALVVANEQTRGRGRLNRRWYTPADAALAFSIVLRQLGQDYPETHKYIPRTTALGALAVCDALQTLYAIKTEIKWPNDVLVGGKKIAGILAEAQWHGEKLASVVLGIGINVAHTSLPPLSDLSFPATCVDEFLPHGRIDSTHAERIQLLHSLLRKLVDWRPLLNSVVFTRAWESKLAYRGEWVQVYQDIEQATAGKQEPMIEGKVFGITSEGALQLLDRSGYLIKLQAGEIYLRPSG